MKQWIKFSVEKREEQRQKLGIDRFGHAVQKGAVYLLMLGLMAHQIFCDSNYDHGNPERAVNNL